MCPARALVDLLPQEEAGSTSATAVVFLCMKEFLCVGDIRDAEERSEIADDIRNLCATFLPCGSACLPSAAIKSVLFVRSEDSGITTLTRSDYNRGILDDRDDVDVFVEMTSLLDCTKVVDR